MLDSMDTRPEESLSPAMVSTDDEEIVRLRFQRNLKIAPDEIVFELKNPELKEIIDTSAYPDDFTLSIFAAIVYKKEVKNGVADAILKLEESLKEKKILEREIIEKVEDLKPDEDWKVVAWGENEYDDYFGAAFWNAKQNQLIISHRGTKFDYRHRKTLLTDVEGIIKRIYTSQVHSACTFCASILKKFEDKLTGPFYVSITGHSLGAWLAQITTFSTEYLELDNEKFKEKDRTQGLSSTKVHTVAFDSPGCSEMLYQISKHYFEKYKIEPHYLISNLDISIYFNTPNIVNCLNSHISISRLLQIFETIEDDQSFLDSLPEKPSWKSLHTHKMANFVKMLSLSKNVKILSVFNWPSFDFPKSLQITVPESKLSFLTSLTTLFKVLSEAMKLLPSCENELKVFFKKVHKFGRSKEKGINEKRDNFNLYYSAEEIDRKSRNLSIFTKQEVEFLENWKRLRNEKVSKEYYKNIEILLQNNQLGNFISFLPLFNLSEKNDKKILSCFSPAEVETAVNRVKHLLTYVSDVYNNILKDTERLLERYENLYISLSKRYISDLPKYDIDFEDTIQLKDFLNSNERIFLLITQQDTKNEMFRLQNIVKNVMACEHEPCFLSLEELKEISNHVDIEQIFQDPHCQTDQVLVIDCSAFEKRKYNFFINFLNVSTHLPEDMKKKLILVIEDKTSRWSQEIPSTYEVKRERYFFSDLTKNTQYNLLKKRVINFRNKKMNLSKFLNLKCPNDLSNDQILNFMSDPNVINYLIQKEAIKNQLCSENIVAYESLKIMSIKVHKELETDRLVKFLTMSKKEDQKHNLVLVSGDFKNKNNSKNDILNYLKLEKTEELKRKISTVNYDVKCFFTNCSINLNKCVYWIYLNANISDRVKLNYIFNPDLYLKRYFYHRIVFDQECLKDHMKNISDCFVLVNKGGSALENILDSKSDFICDLNLHEGTTPPCLATNEKIVVTDDMNKANEFFTEWTKCRQEPIHLIQILENENFVWIKSNGSFRKIRQYLDIDYTISIGESRFSNITDKVVVIAGEPGVGKSSTSLRIAQKISKESWVIWINLINFRKSSIYKSTSEQMDVPFEVKVDKKIDLEIVIDFLQKTNKNLTDPLIRSMLRYGLTNEGLFSIVLFFDGFDEILDEKIRSEIVDILKFLKEKTSAKIWVTTRFWASKILENELSVVARTMKDISKQQQTKFIENFWLPFINLESHYHFSESKANYAAELLITKFEKLLSSGDSTSNSFFVANPLQLRMIAEISQPEIDFDYLRIEPKFTNLSKLYEAFVSYKIHVYAKEKLGKDGDLKNKEINIIKDHESLAFQYLFPEEAKLFFRDDEIFDLKKDYWKNEKDKLNQIGLLQVFESGGDIQFVHVSLAEYLGSRKLYLLLKDLQKWSNNDFEKFIIRDILLKEDYKMIRRFLNDILEDVPVLKFFAKRTLKFLKKDKKENLLNSKGDSPLHVGIKEKNQRLTKKMLEAFSDTQPDIIDIPDNMGQTVLHLAAINYDLELGSLCLLKLNSVENIFYWDDDCHTNIKSFYPRSKTVLGLRINDNDSKKCLWNSNSGVVNRDYDLHTNEKPCERLLYAFTYSYDNAFVLIVKEGQLQHIGNHMEVESIIRRMMEEKKKITFLKECSTESLSILFLWAASHNQWDFLQTIIEDLSAKQEIILSEIFNRSRPNTKQTVLHYASWKNQADFISKMLKYEIDINVRNNVGNTPLIVAAFYGNWNIVELLMNNNADVNIANDNRLTVLHIAAESGKLDIVEKLLHKGAFTDDMDWKTTPILLAAEKGHWEIVETLIKYGANIMVADENSQTLLHLASASGKLDFVKKFIEQGISIDWTDSFKRTPILWATMKNHWDVASELIEQGANIAMADKDSRTVLHFAAVEGHSEFVSKLLDMEISIDALDGWNSTPALLAALHNQWNVVKLLIERRTDIKIPGKNSQTLLHLAAESNQLDVVSILIDKEAPIDALDKWKRTPALQAAVKRNWAIVSELIKHGANVNAADKYSQTLLHFAASNGKLDLVLKLIDSGAILDRKNVNMATPLFTAVLNERWDVVLKLIELGANVNITFENSDTMLHVIARFPFDNPFFHKELVLKLLEKGANMDATDNSKNTPALAAALNDNWHMVSELIDHGANVKIANKYSQTLLHLAARGGQTHVISKLLDKKVSIDVIDKWKKTPIILAATHRHWDIVQKLMEHGAKTDDFNEGGRTLLYYASEAGQLKLVLKFLEDQRKGLIEFRDELWKETSALIAARGDHWDVVLKFIENGANVNVANDIGQTLLHLAARSGQLHIVKKLIFNGALIDAVDEFKNTPLLLAASKKRWDIVKILIEKGANVNVVSSYDGETVLHYAASDGRLEIVSDILEKVVPADQVNGEGETPLLKAAAQNHWDIVEKLIEHGADTTKSSSYLLTYATRGGRLDLVSRLLNEDPCIDKVEKYGSYALIAASEKHWDMVQKFIEHGANVKMADSDDRTLLHYAVIDGRLDVVKKLLDMGASMDSKDYTCNTPLLAASDGGHWEIALEFIKRGDNTDLINLCGGTVLHDAAIDGQLDVVLLLLEKGAFNDKTDFYNKRTPAIWAASENHWEIVKVLIEKGADIYIKDDNSLSVYDYAKAANKEEVLTYALDNAR